MKAPVKSINDITDAFKADKHTLDSIRCTDADSDFVHRVFSSDMYIEAMTTVIVAAGRLDMEINHRTVSAPAGTALVLSPAHLVRLIDCTPNLRCKCLLVGEEFMSNTDSVDMIYKRIRYGVKLFDRPTVKLSAAQMMTLCDRLRDLRAAIDNSVHLYHREVVLNRLYAYYLDLSDIIDRTAEHNPTEHTARYESTVKRFIELLALHFRTEHKVDFYAAQLNFSTHYLTLIVKEVTGRTVSDFIFGTLYGEARALLSESQMSVQEISSSLNFADQSSFCKFFKRHAGISPTEYRKMRESANKNGEIPQNSPSSVIPRR